MSYASKVIEGLLSPTMSQNMAQLGAAIGGIPGQIKEQQEEKEELARFNQISLSNQQGLAAAQKGNIDDLETSINNLRKQMGLAKTIEERRLIQKDLIELQKLMPGAKDTAVSNKAKEIFNLERSLKDSNLGSNQRAAIQKQIDDLKQDPLAMQAYNSLQTAQWTFEKTQKEVQSNNWIKTNSAAIEKAIKEGNTEEVDRLVEEAGEFSKAAQAYVNTSIKNRETLDTFRENSLEKKKGPSVEFYESQIENLPEGVRDVLKADLDAYKNAAEKWNPKTETWAEGSRTDAVKKEKSLQAKINAVFSQVALGDYQQERRTEQVIQEQVFKAELALESASTLTTAEISSARQTVAARYASLKDKDKPSPEEFAKEVAEEEEKIIREKVRSATQILTYLKNYGKDTPVDEGDEDTLESPEAIISEAMKDNPDRTRKEIIEQLIRIGDLPINFIEEESLSEKPRYSFPTGYGTSIERLSKPAEITAANVSSTGY